MTATSGVLIPGWKHCWLTARPRCRRGWLDFYFILNSGDSTSPHCSLWPRKKWSKNKTKNPATLTSQSSKGTPFHPHQYWSAPTFNFCGLLTFGGFLRSFSLRESRSTKLPSTTMPPRTKVSAGLGSSLWERQGQALEGPEGRGRRGTEAEPAQLPSHRGGASSPPAPALLPLLPPFAGERWAHQYSPAPGRPSARPAPRLRGTRPRRVGGAAEPRSRQDPRARTKECGEGARSTGRHAVPAQEPPRALLGPNPRPAPDHPPPPIPHRPSGGKGRATGGHDRKVALCGPLQEPGARPEVQSRSGSDNGGPRAVSASWKATAIIWGNIICSRGESL